jgi:Fe-S-cluster-containing dehydrogenase component
LSCPTHARAFGDFDDPQSAVSAKVRDRGGFGMLEELGYGPVNRYLPPRKPATVEVAPQPAPATGLLKRLQSLAERLNRI